MPKICVISDVHGRDNWKVALTIPGIDKWIFLGDYVDSYDKTGVEIIHNLKEIIAFKKENNDKVELLRGNHDEQYIFPPNFRCTGMRPALLPELNKIFNDDLNLFKIAYQKDNYLFTHAGVTNTWLEWAKSFMVKYGLNDDLSNLGEVLNIISNTSSNWILHIVGEKRGGLRGEFGGPTWADKIETEMDGLKDFHQAVGHTPVGHIQKHNIDANTSVTYCDVLGKDNVTTNDFLVLDI